ncbi:MAG: hypothetical protein JNL82_14750 [Myxococcales bacterium]|nr:hypothetical protein [Myxococcales bacterium]
MPKGEHEVERRCPACGAITVIAEEPRASACLPFPPVVPLRCATCGNTGTELRLHAGAVVRWLRGG